MKKFLIMVMVLVLSLSTVAFCFDDSQIPDGSGVTASTGNVGNVIVSAIQSVAYIVAVAVLMYVGVKFMLASPAEKANIKGMLVPYIIGAVLIFAGGTFVKLLGGFIGQIQ